MTSTHRAPSLECHGLVLGQRFDSLRDFKTSLRKWAIENNFTPAILDSDSRRVRAGCRSSPHCPFRIRCNFSEKDGGATITTLHNYHNCASNSPHQPQNVSRAETSKLKFLLEVVPLLLTVESSTPTRAIIDAIKQKYGTEIALRQAQKVKATLCPRPRESDGRNPQDGESPRYDEGRRGPLQTEQSPLVMNDDSDMQADPDDDTIRLEQLEGRGDENFDSTQRPNLPTNVPVSASHVSSLQTSHGLNTAVRRVEQQSSTSSHSQALLETMKASRLTGGKSPQAIRAEAATLFQRASEKFQEATRLHQEAACLHAEATKLFASVANSQDSGL